ncbi:hypothetical protein [Erwinia phage FBB1]|nr:hypothetical protein [Erwinia phage FBB1]
MIATIAKERGRETLISKAHLGESLNFYEAMSLCHRGYVVWLKDVEHRNFFLKMEFKDSRYAIKKYNDDGCVFEYVTERNHPYLDWIVKF